MASLPVCGGVVPVVLVNPQPTAPAAAPKEEIRIQVEARMGSLLQFAVGGYAKEKFSSEGQGRKSRKN
jgi:hypothetical protein